MLVDHGVSVVFNGHDHMFIKQDLDGIVYQLVPQPGHPRSGVKSAKEYGYLSGEVQGSSGHVRVRVNGDPITKALDANGDGQIDQSELRAAATALRKLDTNQDGQITADELRGPRGQQRGDAGNPPRGGGPPTQVGGPRGPQPGDGPRQPWILVHADEIDLDKN